MEKLNELSLNEKIKITKRILLLAEISGEYSENRKVIKNVAKIVGEEKKSVASSKYPMLDDDRKAVEKYIAELAVIAGQLAKAKKVEDWKLCSANLGAFTERVKSQLAADESLLHPAPATAQQNVKKAIDAAAGTAQKIGEQIGEMVSKVERKIKQTISDNKN